MLRLCFSAVVLCATILGTGLSSAWALQGGEDPSNLPVLLNKQYGRGGQWHVSALFSSSLATKFTESTGALINVQYDVFDFLGFELSGGLFASQETAVMKEIRALEASPILSDLHQMQWLLGGSLVVTPLYGKLSLASEWNPSFDLYFLGGGGIIGTNRQAPIATASAVTPSFHLGLGLRFYVLRSLALRVGFRSYFFEDPDSGLLVDDNLSQQGGDGAAIGQISGLSSMFQWQLGLQYSFGR